MEDIVDQVMSVDQSPEEESPVKSESTPTEVLSKNSWWSGWYESAVEKSSQALDSMKKDLSELSSVVQSESRSVINSSVVSSSFSAVSSTASYIKDTVSALVDEEDAETAHDEELMTTSQSGEIQSISQSQEAKEAKDVTKEAKGQLSKEQSFEDEVKEMLKIPEQLASKAGEKITTAFKVLIDVLAPTGYDDDDVVLLPAEQVISRDRWDLLVRAIQSDPRTYCHEPQGPPEDYESWLEKFNLMDQESAMQRTLDTSPEVRNFHETLVPKELSDDMFWHRYFYRIQQLRDMESKRAMIMKERQQQESQELTESKNANVNIKVLSESESLKKTSPEASNLSPFSDHKEKTTKINVTPMSKGTSPESLADQASSSEESWEKTSMTESIVDEAARKLAEKLASVQQETKSDEEFGEWELE
jgi:hypothetical protein